MRQHWKQMSWREKQLWALIFLAAGAAIPQYVMQSVLIAPGGIERLSEWFWNVDAVLWALRALVESWVICYLFTTRSGNWWQKIMQFGLLLIEIGLLYLIIITAGEALRAVSQGTVPTSPLPWLPWEWALASYTSLMIAGAGFAYRVQPGDIYTEDAYRDQINLLEAQIADRDVLLSESKHDMNTLANQATALESEVVSLKEAVERIRYMGAWFDDLDATNRARLMASILDKDQLPAPKVLADAWGVSLSTIVKAYGQGKDERK